MLEIKTWKAAGAAIQGRGHIKENIQCQDNVAKLRINGVTALALADGAGSRKLSQVGAKIASEAAVKLLTEDFEGMYRAEEKELRHRIMQSVLDELRRVAKQRGVIVGDMASTLLFCGAKGNRSIVGHLGDGVTGFLEGSSCGIVFPPDNEEYANVTVFTTSDDAESSLRLLKVESELRSGYVLMSDGAASSLYHKQSGNLAPAVSLIFDWLRDNSPEVVSDALKRNLEELIRLKTSDDCSIAIMRLEQASTQSLRKKSESELKEILGATRIDGMMNMMRILTLAAEGYTPVRISRKLRMNSATVQRHIKKLTDCGYLQADARK